MTKAPSHSHLTTNRLPPPRTPAAVLPNLGDEKYYGLIVPLPAREQWHTKRRSARSRPDWTTFQVLGRMLGGFDRHTFRALPRVGASSASLQSRFTKYSRHANSSPRSRSSLPRRSPLLNMLYLCMQRDFGQCTPPSSTIALCMAPDPVAELAHHGRQCAVR